MEPDGHRLGFGARRQGLGQSRPLVLAEDQLLERAAVADALTFPPPLPLQLP